MACKHIANKTGIEHMVQMAQVRKQWSMSATKSADAPVLSNHHKTNRIPDVPRRLTSLVLPVSIRTLRSHVSKLVHSVEYILRFPVA